jgi:glutamyl-tRNA reductase
MKIAVVGLNHKTAPVDIREQLAFSADQTTDALGKLKTLFPSAEFVILSTCNRTELYYAGDAPGVLPDDLAKFLSDMRGIPSAEFEDFLYTHYDERAVEHLLNVASSLDSLIIGETQILAQVKQSYRLAIDAGSTGKIINRLFHCAFATSKEVYAITSIAQRRVSVAGVAVELARRLFEHISCARVAVIGAGEMAQLLIRHLVELNCGDITVFNRTLSTARKMAARHNIKAKDWADLQSALRETDIIIGAAGAEDYLFDKSSIQSRRTAPLLIIDIAVPRNFKPDIAELENVHLYSVDDLAQVVQGNIQTRQEDIGQAKEIIADNVESFMDWFALCDIGPLIGEFRKKFQQLSKIELDRFFAGEKNTPTIQKQKTEAAVNRIVNRLTHRLIHNFHDVAKIYGHDKASQMIEGIIKYNDHMEDRQL